MWCMLSKLNCISLQWSQKNKTQNKTKTVLQWRLYMWAYLQNRFLECRVRVWGLGEERLGYFFPGSAPCLWRQPCSDAAAPAEQPLHLLQPSWHLSPCSLRVVTTLVLAALLGPRHPFLIPVILLAPQKLILYVIASIWTVGGQLWSSV